MLLGQFEANLIAGNRLAVPKKYREELESSLVIARWYENCLVLVSGKEWNDLLSRLSGKSEMITQNVRDTDRFILSSAFELNLDAQGRIVIPASLVKFAGIESEAIFLGLGDRIEIWNKKDWIAREDYIAGKSAELIENLAKESREKKNA